MCFILVIFENGFFGSDSAEPEERWFVRRDGNSKGCFLSVMFTDRLVANLKPPAGLATGFSHLWGIKFSVKFLKQNIRSFKLGHLPKVHMEYLCILYMQDDVVIWV